ncbi:DUF885 family protein [Mycoplasma struthionis]|uniref:DUF885 family protein n=1 Tax=Mycoplasma struthionis TaxID=538220 RepID=A0A502M2C0_9MOLU|nr:DUF885 family protein [Mycoplasma struthionis]TPI02813.1 DUF885 family protein [Mycoplasma struthionis]
MNKRQVKILTVSLLATSLVAAPVIAAGVTYSYIKSQNYWVQNFNLDTLNQIKEIKSKNQQLSEDLKQEKAKLEGLDKNSAEYRKQQQVVSDKEAELKNSSDEYNELINKNIKSIETIAKSKGNSEDAKIITAEYVFILQSLISAAQDAELADVDLDIPNAEEAKKISDFYGKWVDKFASIDLSNLNEVTVAWVKGLQFEYSVLRDNYKYGAPFLLSSFSWGAASSYPANSFYDSFKNLEGNLPKALEVLKEAKDNNIVLSKVLIKNNIKYLLETFFQTELVAFYNSTKQEISVNDLLSSASDNPWVEFTKYYANDYYNAATQGLGENIQDLKLTKENAGDKEKENSIEISVNGQSQKIYGLGFTEADLNANNVGLIGVVGNEEINGKTLYDQYLKMATTESLTAQEVNDSGYTTTTTASGNMKKVATEVAKLIAGESGAWKPQIQYDIDGRGPKPVETITVNIRDENGNIDLKEFNKWLNQEQFFFGREDKSYYTDTLKNSLVSDPKLARYVKELKNKGYENLKNSDRPYGSITDKQFYYGALEAFKGYQQFKEQTVNFGKGFFANEVPEFEMYTYRYPRRAIEGVGAYNSGVKAFIFNTDPYFSLPKWSLTSFADHESMMGHHNQIYYAKQYLAKYNDQQLGNIFDYTAYVEGWALFMEWFAIEAGYYGTPDYDSDDNYAMPVDFQVSKGITSFSQARTASEVTDEIVNKIKSLHGGVYWTLTTKQGENNDKEHALRAIKLTNMLQYFGALNEAQLRNMRRAVDTAYHGDIEGHTDLPRGASINQVREFMKSNSALGIGDITSESLRYLVLPAQATSYNAGKESMLGLYTKVRKHFGLTRKEFVEQTKSFTSIGEEHENAEHGYIKEFLDKLLMNGALPLDALKAVIEKGYNLN